MVPLLAASAGALYSLRRVRVVMMPWVRGGPTGSTPFLQGLGVERGAIVSDLQVM